MAAKEGKMSDMTQTQEPSIADATILEMAPDPHKSADVALDFLNVHDSVTYTPEQEKAVLRKIDMWLMPLMFFSYLMQYTDKSVLPQSAIYGLFEDIHLVGQDYSWCSSLFYFGYLAFQPIAAVCLTYCRPGKFVVGISLVWAIVLFATAGVTNYAGMAVCRFVLGAAEGGLSPAYVLITGSWYTQAEIPMRIAIWFCGNGVAIILQSFVSYGIGHIHSGIQVWKWFFIIYGIVALLWAGVLYLYMPDNVVTCKFLNEEEKAIAIERIRANRTGISNPHFKKNQFVEAITDLKVWWTLIYTVIWCVGVTAISSFGSILIKGMGFNTFQSSLLNAPLGVTENIGLLLAGWVCYRYTNMRCIMQIVLTVPAVIGAALMGYLSEENKVGRLIAFYLVNFCEACLPLLWAVTSSNVAGHTKRTTANAIQFIGYSAGLIIGPQFFLGTQAPHYPLALKAMLFSFCVTLVMPGCYYLYLRRKNQKKERLLQASGEANIVVRNEEFLDMTDKEQLRFRYVM